VADTHADHDSKPANDPVCRAVQNMDLQMVGFPTDKQPAGSGWWDECPGTSADFESSATASHQVGAMRSPLSVTARRRYRRSCCSTLRCSVRIRDQRFLYLSAEQLLSVAIAPLGLWRLQP